MSDELQNNPSQNQTNQELGNIIPANQLDDKSSPGISNLLKLSFEYLLAGVCNEYLKNLTEVGNPAEFDKNKLNFTKALVFPFFVSVANGYSKSLYSLFGEFYSFSFGPGSVSIYKELNPTGSTDEIKLNYFKFNSEHNPLGVIINEEKNLNDFSAIQRDTKSKIVNLGKTSLRFDEIRIESDNPNSSTPNNYIYKAIDSAINSIKPILIKSFFEADSKRILIQASYFTAFLEAYNANKTLLIKYNDILESRQQVKKPEPVI